MNNYELHEKTQQLADTETHYALSKRVVELTEELKLAYEDNNKIRGRMHDQWINQNKMKADAVNEIGIALEDQMENLRDKDLDFGISALRLEKEITKQLIEQLLKLAYEKGFMSAITKSYLYANKLERGEK